MTTLNSPKSTGYAASSTNISTAERLLTAAAGGVLAISVLRRTWPRMLLAGVGGLLMYRAVSGYCPVYEAAGMDRSRHRRRPSPEPGEYFERGIHVTQAYTIQKSPEELYNFWKKLENLPKFMRHLQSVRQIADKRSHWIAHGPAGYPLEWDAEIINDQPNALISWKSLPGASVDHAGSVRFVEAPGGRGTEVRVVLDYLPPAGTLGWAAAKLLGSDPQQQIKEDLRRFKQIIEAGETPTIEGQPAGSCEGVR